MMQKLDRKTVYTEESNIDDDIRKFPPSDNRELSFRENTTDRFENRSRG